MQISRMAVTRIMEIRVKGPKCKLSVKIKYVRDLRQPEGKLRSSYPLKKV